MRKNKKDIKNKNDNERFIKFSPKLSVIINKILNLKPKSQADLELTKLDEKFRIYEKIISSNSFGLGTKQNGKFAHYCKLVKAIFYETINKGLLFKGFGDLIQENQFNPECFEIQSKNEAFFLKFNTFENYYYPISERLAFLLIDLKDQHKEILETKTKNPLSKAPYSYSNFPDLTDATSRLSFLFCEFESEDHSLISAFIEFSQNLASSHLLNQLRWNFRYIPLETRPEKRLNVENILISKIQKLKGAFTTLNIKVDISKLVMFVKRKIVAHEIGEYMAQKDLLEEFANSLLLLERSEFETEDIEELIELSSHLFHEYPRFAQIEKYCRMIESEFPESLFIEIFIAFIRHKISLNRGATAYKTDYRTQQFFPPEKINSFINDLTSNELRVYFILAFYTGVRSISLRHLTGKNFIELFDIPTLTYVSKKMHHSGKVKLADLIPTSYLTEIMVYIKDKQDQRLFDLSLKTIRSTLQKSFEDFAGTNLPRESFANHLFISLTNEMESDSPFLDMKTIFSENTPLKAFSRDPEKLIKNIMASPVHLTGDALNHSIKSIVSIDSYLSTLIFAIYLSRNFRD